MPESPSRKILLALITSAALLACAELGLRIYGFKFAPRDIPLTIWNAVEDGLLDEADSLHRSDANSLWIPRGGARIPWTETEHVNALGYRGAELERGSNDQAFRVAFLGDSTTFGWMVTEEQTFAQKTVKALSDSGVRAEALNAGVIGYSVAQGLSRYRTLVRSYRPDVVVLGFGAVNDHLNAPSQEPDLQKIDALRDNEGLSGKLTAWCRETLRITHFVSWLRFEQLGGEPAIRKKLKAARRLETTSMDVIGKANHSGKRRVSIAEYSELLEKLVTAMRLDGAEAILLSMPRKQSAEERSPVLEEYSTATTALGERLDVTTLDLRSLLRSYTDLYDPEREDAADLALFFDYWHPRPHGHRIIADALTPPLLDLAQKR